MLSCVKSTCAARWQVLLSRRKEGDKSPPALPGRAEQHPSRWLLLQGPSSQKRSKGQCSSSNNPAGTAGVGIFSQANEFPHAPTPQAELLLATCSNNWAPGGESSQISTDYTRAVYISAAHFFFHSESWTLAHLVRYTNSSVCWSPLK